MNHRGHEEACGVTPLTGSLHKLFHLILKAILQGGIAQLRSKARMLSELEGLGSGTQPPGGRESRPGLTAQQGLESTTAQPAAPTALHGQGS